MKRIISAVLLTLALSLNAAHAEEKDLRNTFAVVWNYVTTDQELINANVADQAAETLALWKNCLLYTSPSPRDS